MNKNLLIVIVVIVVLFVGYLVISNKPAQPTPQPTEVTEAPVPPTEVTVDISQQNDSGEAGTATVMEVDGKVKVTLSLSGAPQDVAQPAHIHMGSCPDVGEVKYPLTSPLNGVSETMLEVSLDQLKSELPLAINVHKSQEEAAVYVSCGNITL